MKVKDVMSSTVISVGSEEPVSKALSMMSASRVHQLAVIDKKSLFGMIELKAVITKDINPAEAKVANFVKKVPSLSENDELMEALELLLRSGMRALPVIEKGQVVGILSETDVLKNTKGMIGKDITLKQITTQCVYVDKYTKASKIQNLMFETNVSRIPVLENDTVVGVVGTLDLIKVLEARTPGHRGEKTTEKDTSEKMKTSDITAEAIMSTPVVLDSKTKVMDAIKHLQESEELIVKNGDVGIVTPKDVLELLYEKDENSVPVQLIGLGDEDIEFKAKMDSLIQKSVKRYGKMVDRMEYMLIHVEKMHKQGPKQKYSIRIRMKAPMGFFVAHAWGWKPVDVLQEAFDILENEIMKKHGKVRGHEKQKKSKARRRV